jgi:hypothetical protein
MPADAAPGGRRVRAADRQTAVEALLLVVKYNGPTMFARIAMMQALHPQPPQPITTSPYWSVPRRRNCSSKAP